MGETATARTISELREVPYELWTEDERVEYRKPSFPVQNVITSPEIPATRNNVQVNQSTIVFQAEGHPPQLDTDGILHSPGPAYELIPLVGMRRLAARFELGEVRKGKGAWNATSDNQSALASKRALLKRLGHAIDHSFKLMHKVINDMPFDEDDDAAAIAWAGFYAISATDAIEKERLANGV